jgi:methionyl-tRNA formyltransferase
MPLRLVFMGTPDFAVPTLRKLRERGHHITAVYTREPKPGGRRGMELQPTPVEREARSYGLSVLTPKTLRTPDAQETFRSHAADVAVVVAYGLILPKPILEAPRLGCFNLHASALPRWRGAAPINRAIMAGDAATAVMVMRMEEGLDTGPVAMAEWVPIEPDMTAGELHDRLALLGADLVGGALEKLEMHVLQLKPQPRDGITYATKIDKAETRIDWTKSWRQVHDHCRGLSPFPGAWCEIGGTRIKVLRTTKGEGSGVPGKVLDDNLTVACGDGAIRILRLQVAGKRAMTADEYLHGMRGMHVAPGTVLG